MSKQSINCKKLKHTFLSPKIFTLLFFFTFQYSLVIKIMNYSNTKNTKLSQITIYRYVCYQSRTSYIHKSYTKNIKLSQMTIYRYVCYQSRTSYTHKSYTNTKYIKILTKNKKRKN